MTAEVMLSHFVPLMYAVAVEKREKDGKKKRGWRQGEIKKWGQKLSIDAAANSFPGQLGPKWMIFIKSLGFVSSISYISPNRGRPSLYLPQEESAALLLFSGACR